MIICLYLVTVCRVYIVVIVFVCVKLCCSVVLCYLVVCEVFENANALNFD